MESIRVRRPHRQEFPLNGLILSLTAIVQIVLINAVLSGDNALVIAMAARDLPHSQRRAASRAQPGAEG